MRKSPWLLAALLITICFICQTMTGSDSKCTDCVTKDLASIHANLGATTHHSGQPIALSLVLTAGSKGVYLPAYFGDFETTCQNGFNAALLTEHGSLADPNTKGCAGVGGHSASDTAASELHNFVHLKPGEERTWRTELPTTGIKPGKYSLIGEYISSGYMIQEVAKLPEVNGLMAIGRIDSKSIVIQIIP